jgi:HD-like signal output (HDOD) protein
MAPKWLKALAGMADKGTSGRRQKGLAADPTQQDKRTAMPDASAVTRADAEESLKKIRLPSCPVILTRLLREMRADEPDFSVVARLISSDVRLAGEMIKTVNSPFYGLQVKVASVQQALNVIGLRNVTQLITGLLLRDAFAAGATKRMQVYSEVLCC